MLLLETQKGAHNGLDGVLAILRLAEDDRGVGFKALIGDLEALGDNLAVQVVLALVEEHLANTVICVVNRGELVHAEDVGVIGTLAQLTGDAIGIQGLGVAQPRVVVVGVQDLITALGVDVAPLLGNDDVNAIQGIKVRGDGEVLLGAYLA